MGTPFVILVAGQNNVMHKTPLTWTPNPRVKVWNNIVAQESEGDAFVSPSSSEISLPIAYASAVADKDPSKDVYVVVIAAQNSDILSWVGGGRWLVDGNPGVNRIHLNANTPQLVTKITINTIDSTNTPRPSYLSNYEAGRVLRIGYNGMTWIYNVVSRAGNEFTVTWVSSPVSMPPSNWCMLEAPPMAIEMTQMASAAALNHLGLAKADTLLWWHGTGDSENPNYSGEFNFYLNYMRDQRTWFPKNVVLCTIAGSAVTGIPGSDSVNTQIRSQVSVEPNRVLADVATLPDNIWVDNGLGMTAVGYQTAADYISNIYAYPPPRPVVGYTTMRVRNANGNGWINAASASNLRIRAADGTWINKTGNLSGIGFLDKNDVWYKK